MDTYRHTLPLRVARDLRAARQASPWPLASLAAEVGISRGHLIRIQNGTRAPSSTVATRLVDALDLDPDHGLGANLIRHSIAGVGHDRWPSE
jgi:transcriptional regulator with XRE-family HTH domain